MEQWRAQLYQNELYHHGILGMRWGKKNGPPYPLDASDHSASERKAGWRKSLGGGRNEEWYKKREEEKRKQVTLKEAKKNYKRAVSNSYFGDPRLAKAEKALQKAQDEADWARKDREAVYVKNKLANEKGKGKLRSKWEQEYREKGMNAEEAAIAAYKKEQTIKVIAAVGLVTVAAVGAYAGYQYYKNHTDQIIKSGTVMQNIAGNSNVGVRDAFYAAHNKADMIKYKGIYGNQIRMQQKMRVKDGNSAFRKTLSATSDIKVASRDSGRKILDNMIKNDFDFRVQSVSHLENMRALMPPGRQRSAIERAIKDIKNGKMSGKGYDGFNIGLVDHTSSTADNVQKAFYDSVRKAGYDALNDINDRKYSGYKAKSANIYINKSKIAVDKVRKMDDSEIGRNLLGGIAILDAEKAAKAGAAIGAGLAAKEGARRYKESRTDNQIVSDYKKEHPNTNLSYNEIVRMERKKKH